MSTPTESTAPAGIRPARADGQGPFVWAAPGSFSLKLGDRVAVHDGDREWLGEVVVPPGQLVEWPDLGGLPTVLRRLHETEWPEASARAGRQLLESLGLPPDLLAPPA